MNIWLCGNAGLWMEVEHLHLISDSPRTELIFWVRVPRRVALLGLFKRVFRYYGSVRPEMADGCPEPLPDRSFCRTYGTLKSVTRLFLSRGLTVWTRNSVVVFRSHYEMDAIVKSLTERDDSFKWGCPALAGFHFYLGMEFQYIRSTFSTPHPAAPTLAPRPSASNTVFTMPARSSPALVYMVSGLA